MDVAVVDDGGEDDVRGQQQQRQQQQQQELEPVVDYDAPEWFELEPREQERLRSISFRSSSGGDQDQDHQHSRHHSRRSSSRRRRKKRTTWDKFKELLRSFFAFVFSSVGICVVVNVYLFVGAYAFMELEGRRRFVDRLWQVTDRLNTLHPGNWSLEVRAEVARFQEHIIAQVGDGYAGQDLPTPKWSYSGSLLYAITVITTIGMEYYTYSSNSNL